jgi:hypothetical protein
LLDLSNVAGLSPQLAETLDNFEGMAFGPRLDGGPTLILVSDDNFSTIQRTTFLLFSIAARSGRRAVFADTITARGHR